MDKKTALTERQAAFLALVFQFMRYRNVQPSLKEMAELMAVESDGITKPVQVTSVTSIIGSLERKGYLRRTGKRRSIEFLRDERGHHVRSALTFARMPS